MKINLFAHWSTNTHTCTLSEKLLERSATFDSFFYILGQLTRSPTKLSSPIFDSPPRHRAVAPLAGPNDEADCCVRRHFVKNRAWQLWKDSRGQREMRILSCSDKTPRLNFSASGNACVFVLLWANRLIFEKNGLLNNYYTPVLISMYLRIILNYMNNRPLSLYRWLSVGSVVTIRSPVAVAHTNTCSAPNKQGRTCTAPSLDGARAGLLAITLFGAKHGGHCHRQCASTLPSFRRQMGCVTAELVDFDRDSRTDGLVYTAALFIHFRRSFLEFLRISKTLL